MSLGSILFPIIAIGITLAIFWGVRNLIKKIEKGEQE
jgi:hypothetical protein